MTKVTVSGEPEELSWGPADADVQEPKDPNLRLKSAGGACQKKELDEGSRACRFKLEERFTALESLPDSCPTATAAWRSSSGCCRPWPPELTTPPPKKPSARCN